MVGVRRAARDESGFTLIELLVAMLLFGILIAIAVGPYRKYERAQNHMGTTRKVVAALRNAQVRAVAEDATYRITFAADGRSFVRERLAGGSWIEALTTKTDAKMYVKDALFQQPDGSTSVACYFYPRGSATKGTLTVARDDSAKTYTVTVEGLTARVSYS